MEENPDDLLVRKEPVTVEPPRRGCSCFTAGMYLLFLFAGLCVVGVTLMEHYIRNQHMKSLSPRERAAFTAWLGGTIDVPADVMEIPEAASKETLEAKQRLFRDAELEHRRWKPITDNTIPPRHSIVDILKTSGPLTTEQLSLVTTTTAGFPPLLKRAQALVAKPDYMLPDQGYPALHHSAIGSRRFIAMASVYGYYKIDAGEPGAVAEVIDVLMESTRSGPASGYFATIAQLSGSRESAELATALAKRTSETTALKSLLDVMNVHAARLAALGQEYNFLGDSIPIRRQMLADGYLKSVSTIRGELVLAPYEEKQYLEWLLKHVSPTEERYSVVEEQLKEFQRYSSDFLPKPMRKYSQYPPFPFIGEIIDRASTDIQRYWTFESSQSQYRFWAATTNAFNTARLQLALRIAELQGERKLATPGDFVPQYLPEYPLDVTTSSPLAVPAPVVPELRGPAR